MNQCKQLSVIIQAASRPITLGLQEVCHNVVNVHEQGRATPVL